MEARFPREIYLCDKKGFQKNRYKTKIGYTLDFSKYEPIEKRKNKSF